MPLPDWVRGDDADSKEIRETFRAEGWDGRCRLWSGARCNKGKCHREGSKFVTPVTAPSPKMRPQGYVLADRQIRSCPERIPMRHWAAMRRWADWKRFGSLPEAGCVGDQDAWTVSAFEVLEGESSLIELAQREEREAVSGG